MQTKHLRRENQREIKVQSKRYLTYINTWQSNGLLINLRNSSLIKHNLRNEKYGSITTSTPESSITSAPAPSQALRLLCFYFHHIPELSSSCRHVGGSSKGLSKDNKPVRGRPLPTLCFTYYSNLLPALASTATDFSNDVANLSAADLEDIREVIENLSNLAFDYSILGDLMSPNPNVCNHSRALRVSEDLKQPGVFSWQ